MGDRSPRIAIILGSGLGPLAEDIVDPVVVPFSDVPHMRTSTASGHVGRFVIGSLAGKPILCMQGRLHGYEGYGSQDVAFPVWVMAHMGIDTLIVTNAAGAINETFDVGDFCVISDHINFTGRNPVAGQQPDRISQRFYSMYEAYDPALQELALRCAEELSIPMHRGVYLGLLGPSFETAAEIRAFRSWGADTVAMSICEEVIAARHVDLRVLGISLCSNMACGVKGSDPTDEEVFEVARSREYDFCRMMEMIIELMPVRGDRKS